jgi:hypothetical protein
MKRTQTDAVLPCEPVTRRTLRKPRKNMKSFSTTSGKSLDSGILVSTSRKTTELSIEARYGLRAVPNERDRSHEASPSAPAIPDEGERARLIRDISRVIREPQLPETTRSACLTLIGWLARRMPGEAAHALGVAEARRETSQAARHSERRLRTAQSRKR